MAAWAVGGGVPAVVPPWRRQSASSGSAELPARNAVDDYVMVHGERRWDSIYCVHCKLHMYRIRTKLNPISMR